jgi:TusA-related sulfurtransferase
MKINGETKISELIRENPHTIEAIIKVNPRFRKLKNPLLRGILASRTSLADAARIGKSDIMLLFQSLEDIGFEVEAEPASHDGADAGSTNQLILEAIEQSKIVSLDVRPTLDRGGDPFNEIMRELMLLEDGYTLEVINSFEPTPLIKIANDKGYESMVEMRDDLAYTYFIRAGEAKEQVQSDNMVFKISVEEHEKRVANCNKKIVETDVRDLEMPLPMVTILNKLETMGDDEALYVHHKKIPQYLLPELAERNFKVWIAEVDDHNVKLLILK